MKIIFVVAALAVSAVSAAVDPFTYAASPEPSAVMVNFAHGAATRGFAWQTDASVTNGELRLVRGAGAKAADFDRASLVFAAESKRVKDPDLVRHRALATGLRKGETYSYRLGVPGHYATGTVEVKAPSETVTILNLNDAQTKRMEKFAVWENTLAAAAKTVGGAEKVDFIVNGGDLMDGWFLGGTNRVYGKIGRPVEWALAVDCAAPFFPGVPWVSASGNHDFWMYKTYMAVDYPQGVYPGCESLDYGNVHFATVPYVHDDWSAHYEAIYKWLAKDLAANRGKSRDGWTVVALHWGPYTTGDHGALAATTNFIRRLTPLFATNRVDLVLQAHDHTYSKTLPYRWSGRGFTTNRNDRAVVNVRPAQLVRSGLAYDHLPNGTYYVSSGCAGHRVGENVAYAAPTGKLSFVNRPYWLAADTLDVDSPWGRKGDIASADLPRSMFGILRVEGRRLVYEAYVAGTNGTATLFDTLRVSKEPVPVVPLLSERQKSFLNDVPNNLESPAARFDDPSYRTSVAAAGWHPQPVRLSYGGRRFTGERVTVRELATGAPVWEGAGEGWFADVWNLKVGETYGWSVADASGRVRTGGCFRTEDRAPRLLKVDGVPNVRDLGGWRGLDGRRIRQGLVYRTSGLNDNATADCYDYEDVRRLHAEGRLLPAFANGPESNDVRRLIAHLERGDVDLARDVNELFPKPNGRHAGKSRLDEATRRYLVETLGIRSDIDLRGNNETWGMTGSPLGPGVRWFHCSGCAYGDMGKADGKRRFAKAFRVFLDPANYPIAFHCIGGQDRTGAVACILEALLGVAEDDIWRDWQLSALYNDWTRFGGSGGSRWFGALLNVLKACPGETLAEKAAAYVKSCGFSDSDVAALRERLLEPATGVPKASGDVTWIDGATLPLEAPFGRFEIAVPSFPARDFPITDYGAKPGVKATEAFAAAMKACSEAGGGRVVVPAGTWLTGAVRFRSNCNLFLDRDAVLEFTDDPADYPKVHTTWEGVECLNHSPLLYAYEVENVAITGFGLIRPRMDLWRTWFARPPAHLRATEALYHWCSTNAPLARRDLMAIEGSHVRPHLIQFNRARNVLLDGFRIRESPFWMIHLYHSENCVVRNLETYAHGHNNDGVDVDMTQNVLVENCTFDQGDDGLVLKAGRNADAWRLNRPTANVVIRNCHFKNCHTLLACGSELSGGIRNVWMTRCRCDATFAALRIKTNPRRGGFVENVWLENCDVGEVECLADLQTQCYYQWKDFPDYEIRYTRIRNVHVDGLDVRKAEKAFSLLGDWHLKPSGLHFRNIGVGAVLDQFSDVCNCEDVMFDNVRLKPDGGTQKFCLNRALPVTGRAAELSEGHRRAAAFFRRPDYRDGTMPDGVYDLGAGAVATVREVVLKPFNGATVGTDPAHDRFYGVVGKDDFACFKTGESGQVMGLWHTEWSYFPAGFPFCDGLSIGMARKVRLATITIRMDTDSANVVE